MDFKRTDRLTELLKEEIGLALRKVKDPRLSGFLTVTDVALAKDIKSAVVYFSILGSDQDKESSGVALNSAAPFIRSLIRTRVRLRIIPTLSFEYDTTPERAGRVLEILNTIEKERLALDSGVEAAPAPQASQEPAPEAAPEQAARRAPRKAPTPHKPNARKPNARKTTRKRS